MSLTTQDIHKVVLYASDGITPLVTSDGIKTTVADGANVALGAKADAAVTNPALSASEIALLKGLLTQLQLGGNVAHDAADSGNPVKIGGKASSVTPTAVTASDRVDAYFNTFGEQVIAALGTQNLTDASALNVNSWIRSDGGAANMAAVVGALFNGTNYDRPRNQEKTTLLASAARTVTTSANLTLYNNCAVLIVVDVTARAAATTLTPSLVMGQSGYVANKTIWTAAAAINSASGTFMYVFWPMPTIASPTGFVEVINTPLFRELQVTITPNDANSVTYSVVAYTGLVG